MRTEGPDSKRRRRRHRKRTHMGSPRPSDPSPSHVPSPCESRHFDSPLPLPPYSTSLPSPASSFFLFLSFIPLHSNTCPWRALPSRIWVGTETKTKTKMSNGDKNIENQSEMFFASRRRGINNTLKHLPLSNSLYRMKLCLLFLLSPFLFSLFPRLTSTPHQQV